MDNHTRPAVDVGAIADLQRQVAELIKAVEYLARVVEMLMENRDETNHPL